MIAGAFCLLHLSALLLCRHVLKARDWWKVEETETFATESQNCMGPSIREIQTLTLQDPKEGKLLPLKTLEVVAALN